MKPARPKWVITFHSRIGMFLKRHDSEWIRGFVFIFVSCMWLVIFSTFLNRWLVCFTRCSFIRIMHSWAHWILFKTLLCSIIFDFAYYQRCMFSVEAQAFELILTVVFHTKAKATLWSHPASILFNWIINFLHRNYDSCDSFGAFWCIW